jgi:hypothetical protein
MNYKVIAYAALTWASHFLAGILAKSNPGATRQWIAECKKEKWEREKSGSK